MLTYQRLTLKARVNTFLGSLLLASWALGCGLVVWNASFGDNPVANAFTSVNAVEVVDGY